MGRKRRPTAAGAVVLQGQGEDAQVLVIHRPRYDDWSLPKGKLEPDEDAQVAAVREVEEETGLKVRLRVPLGRAEYIAKGAPKSVLWWVGTVVGGRIHPPVTTTKTNGKSNGKGKNGDVEVDRVEWWTPKQAAAKLSYTDDREMVERALATVPGHTVLLVRHAKAVQRKHWSGKDWKRPLSQRGRRQARRLAKLLEAYGITQPITSSSTRCVQTLQPFAERTGLDLVTMDELSEEVFEDDPGVSERAMVDLLNQAHTQPGAPMAICGHRPLLPMMRGLLGLGDKPMLVGETQVVHHDDQGNQVAVERIPSAF
ncbi:NUDIX hydrolase [Propionibacteriaceae bacterium Y1923]